VCFDAIHKSLTDRNGEAVGSEQVVRGIAAGDDLVVAALLSGLGSGHARARWAGHGQGRGSGERKEGLVERHIARMFRRSLTERVLQSGWLVD